MNEIITPEGAIVQQTPAIAAIQKSEVEAQLDAAHKYKRRISPFIDDAKSMIARSQDIAATCFYSLPRQGKQIMGPSVRLAEIAASAYGNLHVGARPLDVGPTDTEVVSQGVAWDLQKNLRVTMETRRRITDKNGRRYSQDMIIMTQNAASAIAMRNAVFKVIPRAYIDELYEHARSVAVGDVRAIGERRRTVVGKLLRMGATEDRIMAKVQRRDVEEITAEDIETLIGIGTSIHDGSSTVEEQFPEIKPETEKTTLDDVTKANKAKADTPNSKRKLVIDAAATLWGDDSMLELGKLLRGRKTSVTDATDDDLDWAMTEISDRQAATEAEKG